MNKNSGQNDGGKNSFYSIPRDKVNTLLQLQSYLNINEENVDWNTVIKGFPYDKEFPAWVTDLETLNELLGDSFYRGNVLKTFWLSKGIRHEGTNPERELNKRQWYINRLKEKEGRS